MTLPNRKNGTDTIDRLERWLASNPEIPHFRQRANKAAICRQIGIARSTADANPEVRALLATLNVETPMAKRTTLALVPEPKNTLVQNPTALSWEFGRRTDIVPHSLKFEHLLKTGRVIR